MKQFASLIEKVFWTYWQSVISLLLVGGGLAKGGFTTELAVAALPAALTVIANGLPLVPAGLSFAEDLLWRVLRSAAVAFLGFLLAMQTFALNADSLRAAGTAALVAALVVIKGVAAKAIGDPTTPATLPANFEDSALAA